MLISKWTQTNMTGHLNFLQVKESIKGDSYNLTCQFVSNESPFLYLTYK